MSIVTALAITLSHYHNNDNHCIATFRDIEKVHDGIGTNLAILIQYLSTFVAGLLGAFYLNWEMTFILLATTPFIVAPSAVFNQVSC